MTLKPYKTVKSVSETEFVINKSRFIGRCFPVSDEEDALAKLEQVRKLHYDATHNCWAYNLRNGVMRFSDDGEPGGTAGMPIMDTLIRSNTLDALIVVTRYFGGILLGSGGLVRAYSRSASDALAASAVLNMIPCNEIEFTVDYSRYGSIELFVRSCSTVKATDFTDVVKFSCLVPFESSDAFIADIINRTDGRSNPRIISEEYIAK